jgi:hypothetical protein
MRIIHGRGISLFRNAVDFSTSWETKNFAQQCSGHTLKIGSPNIRKIGGALIDDANCENISAVIARRGDCASR